MKRRKQEVYEAMVEVCQQQMATVQAHFEEICHTAMESIDHNDADLEQRLHILEEGVQQKNAVSELSTHSP